MSTSLSSAMKSSLVVVVLLLRAVVASQAHQVSCENSWKEAMAFNGMWTGVGVTTNLEVKSVIVVEVYDGKGVKQVGKFKCPEDVESLEFAYTGQGFVKAQITDFRGLGSTLHSGRRVLRDSVKLDIPIALGGGAHPGGGGGQHGGGVIRGDGGAHPGGGGGHHGGVIRGDGGNLPVDGGVHPGGGGGHHGGGVIRGDGGN